MSERYTRLFSLPENLGQDGCPVLISAGALLKDNNTGKVLAQLKMRNISERIIRSVKVKINAYDTAGIALKGVETFSYLDLTVGRDREFGSQIPIALPDKTTRSFSIEILSVVFGNGEVYQPVASSVANSVNAEIAQKIKLLDNERAERQITLQRKKSQDTKDAVKILLVIFIIIIFFVSIFAFCNYKTNKRAEEFRKEAEKILIELCGRSWSTEDHNSRIRFTSYPTPYILQYDTDIVGNPMVDWEQHEYSIETSYFSTIDDEKAILSAGWKPMYIYYTVEADGSYTITKIQYRDELYYELKK